MTCSWPEPHGSSRIPPCCLLFPRRSSSPRTAVSRRWSGRRVGAPTPLSDVFAFGKTLSTLCSDIIPFETRARSNRSRARDSRVQHSDSGPRRVGTDQSASLQGLGRAACPGGSAPSGAPPDPDVDPERRVRRRGLARRRRAHRRFACAARCSIRCQASATSVITGPCASGIAFQFFNDPESVPNTSCLSAAMPRTGLP